MFQYRVVYNLCLKYDPNQAKNIGSTVNIVVQVCNAQNTNLSSASIKLVAITAENNGKHLVPIAPGNSNPPFNLVFSSFGEDLYLRAQDRQPVREDDREELLDHQDLDRSGHRHRQHDRPDLSQQAVPRVFHAEVVA